MIHWAICHWTPHIPTSVSFLSERSQHLRAIDDRTFYMTAPNASEGDIVRIDLDEQACCFAKLLVSPLFCFYDNRTPRSDARPVVDPGAILFKVWVSKEGWTNTRWKVVGHEDLSDIEQESPTFFKIDPIKKDYYLYGNARFMPASREECIGLERAAVWDPVHVEERLRAHFAGERSIFADSLKA
jgi:Immunity protein 26